MNENKGEIIRNLDMDILKGIGILSVVIGHVCNITKAIKNQCLKYIKP